MCLRYRRDTVHISNVVSGMPNMPPMTSFVFERADPAARSTAKNGAACRNIPLVGPPSFPWFRRGMYLLQMHKMDNHWRRAGQRCYSNKLHMVIRQPDLGWKRTGPSGPSGVNRLSRCGFTRWCASLAHRHPQGRSPGTSMAWTVSVKCPTGHSRHVRFALTVHCLLESSLNSALHAVGRRAPHKATTSAHNSDLRAPLLSLTLFSTTSLRQ